MLFVSTRACPFCATPTPADRRDCATCGAHLVKRCPYCAEDVALTAGRCRTCDSDLVDGTELDELAATPARGSRPLPARPLWVDIVLACLAFITAGGVALVLLLGQRPAYEKGAVSGYLTLAVLMTALAAGMTARVGDDLNAHAGRAVARPGRDALLVLATAGLWGIVVAIRYPNAFNDIERREGVPSTDVLAVSVVLACVWLAPVGQIVLQDAMNRHGRLHAP